MCSPQILIKISGRVLAVHFELEDWEPVHPGNEARQGRLARPRYTDHQQMTLSRQHCFSSFSCFIPTTFKANSIWYVLFIAFLRLYRSSSELVLLYLIFFILPKLFRTFTIAIFHLRLSEYAIDAQYVVEHFVEQHQRHVQLLLVEHLNSLHIWLIWELSISRSLNIHHHVFTNTQ